MVIALTGLCLVVFVVVHMLGNLQLFEGPHALNRYAAFLRDMPIVLWMVRIGLLSIAVLHIGLAVQLSIRSIAIDRHRSRPAQ